ncbi:MAG: carboxylesterase family protein [Actinobacteria bacterium]|nr:carboxylesterase family protein [Actinomycetota bacterium]
MKNNIDPIEGISFKPGKVVDTAGGPVRGKYEDGIHIYLGIPFAAPPVGELRWKPPQPASPWTGTRHCVAFGPSCPQQRSKFLKIGEKSEDCLYLNVWTPNPDPAAGMPVMFWLQGGNFQTGSAAVKLYEGKNMATRGAVMVTINYRVGPLGFLAHPDLSKESPDGVSGNYGLLDQVAALEWVRDNIEGFGGDPSRVTIFGFSSGANCVCNLMVMDKADGLYSRAIIESGPLWSHIGVPGLPSICLEREKGEEIGKKFQHSLGFDGAKNIIGKMREIDPETLLEVAGTDGVFVKDGLEFCPVADGHTMRAHPMALFHQRKQADVPLIIGSNRHEANLFLHDAKFSKLQYEMMVRMVTGSHADDVFKLFPFENDEQAGENFGKIMAIGEFATPARFVARCMEHKSSDQFLYQFTGHMAGHPFKACHGAEVAYVLGNLNPAKCDETDFELSRIIMGYWLNFARTGNPNGEGLPEWPVYDSEKDPYMILGKPVSTRQGVWRELCDIAERIYAPIYLEK